MQQVESLRNMWWWWGVCVCARALTVIWLPFEGRIIANDILEENYSS